MFGDRHPESLPQLNLLGKDELPWTIRPLTQAAPTFCALTGQKVTGKTFRW